MMGRIWSDKSKEATHGVTSNQSGLLGKERWGVLCEMNFSAFSKKGKKAGDNVSGAQLGEV